MADVAGRVTDVGSLKEKENEAPFESRPSHDGGGRSSPKRIEKPTRNVIDRCISPFSSPKLERRMSNIIDKCISPFSSPKSSPRSSPKCDRRVNSIRRHHNLSEATAGSLTSVSSLSCPNSPPSSPVVGSPLLVPGVYILAYPSPPASPKLIKKRLTGDHLSRSTANLPHSSSPKIIKAGVAEAHLAKSATHLPPPSSPKIINEDVNGFNLDRTTTNPSNGADPDPQLFFNPGW